MLSYYSTHQIGHVSISLTGYMLKNMLQRVYLITNQFDWLIGMLLVSRSRLVEEDAVEVFYYNGFHLSSSTLM